MRLNKFFILLLALPMFVVGCEKSSTSTSEAILTLTSNDTMTFDGEGGEGEITYTLKNSIESIKLSATCEAEWISNLNVGDKVTFTVEANEGEARETKILVAYGDQKFEVKVRQNEMDDPVVDGDVFPFEWAQRYSLAEMGYSDNYFAIKLSDNADYTQFGIVLIGEEGENILSAGTYTKDNGGILIEGCELYIGEDEQSLTEHYFDEGNIEVIVGGDINGYSLDIKATDNDGNNFHFIYNGVIKGMDLNGADIALDIEKIYCFPYGATESGAYQYLVVLSDKGMTDNNQTIQGSFYYLCLIYCQSEGTIDAEGYVTLPEGVYTIDTTMQAGTLGYAKFVPSNHMSLNDAISFEQCELTITADSLTISGATDEDRHLSSYNDTPRFIKR